MADVVLGVLAVLAGVVFCFRGLFVMRLVIPIWGAFAGFAFGAGLVAGLADERFLGTVLGWVLGLVFAVVFGLLAYLYFAVGVLLAMAAIGFGLGSALVVALGIDWTWVAVLVGVAVGAVLGIVAIVSDLPMLILVVFSALGGATAITTGLMLVVGAVDSADFTGSSFSSHVRDDWWWYLLYLVLAVAGILSQTRDVAAIRRSVRESWSAA